MTYRWTKEQPKTEGWFWYRMNAKTEPEIMNIHEVWGNMMATGANKRMHVNSLAGEWAGPIRKPE